MTELLSQQTGLEAAFIKISLDGLLRADITARTAAYSTMLQAGVYSINDVRSFEDLRPIEDPSADTVRVPVANVNVDAADLSAMSEKVNMAQRLIQVGFDPADVMAKLELPDINHTGKDSVQLQPEAVSDQ